MRDVPVRVPPEAEEEAEKKRRHKGRIERLRDFPTTDLKSVLHTSEAHRGLLKC